MKRPENRFRKEIEVGGDADAALPASRFPSFSSGMERFQHGHRSARSPDHHFLPAFHRFQETGEVGLGFVHIDRFNGSRCIS